MAEPGDRGRDPLVEATFVRDEAEGEMIRGLLESAGIPSILEQAGMIDGARLGFQGIPVYGGAQKVMVHAHRLEEAREVLVAPLGESEQEAPEPANARYLEEASGRGPRGYGLIGGYARIFLWSFGAMALIFGAWLLARVIS